MNPTDRVTVVVTVLMEAAMAGGMSEVQAKLIYEELMKRYVKLETQRAGFFDALSVALREALETKVKKKN
jgi:hypothetical protein